VKHTHKADSLLLLSRLNLLLMFVEVIYMLILHLLGVIPGGRHRLLVYL
jgi:hypothetical protein